MKLRTKKIIKIINNFIILFLVILSFSCNKKTDSKGVLPDSLEILFNLPVSWKKDKDLNVWRNNKTGASFNLEIEKSTIDLDLYVNNAIKLVKKIYVYEERGRSKFKIGKFNAVNIIGELHLSDFDIFVHNIIVEQEKLKINMTIAFDKNKRVNLESDYKFIINSLRVKNANNK